VKGTNAGKGLPSMTVIFPEQKSQYNFLTRYQTKRRGRGRRKARRGSLSILASSS